MPDLWELLEHDGVLKEVAQGLRADDGLQLVAGPPGVGKSFLSVEIGRAWDAAGGVTLVAQGDPGRAGSALYPFDYAMAGLPSHWKTAAPIVLGVGRAVESLVGTQGLITLTVETLARLPQKRRARRARFLGESAQPIINQLEQKGKKRPILLIADNLHWWDSESLDLLRMLMGPELRDTIPFLDQMRVLAVETVPPYQTVSNPRAHDDLLADARGRRFSLDRAPRNRFRDVLVALGAPPTLAAGTADEIYVLSGAHLVLAERAAQYLTLHGADALLATSDVDDFKRVLLSQRMHSLGGFGREATALLQVASALGLTFRQDEILCALDTSQTETRRLLRSCRDESVLEVQDQTYRFVHDIFRQFFAVSGPVDSVAVHERLTPCLQVLRSADYGLRAQNAMEAEQLAEAAVLWVQAALQRQRENEEWRTVLAGQPGDVIRGQGFEPVLELLTRAWSALSTYDFDNCREMLGQLPHGLPRSLVAEAAYIQAMGLMATRSETDREAGRACLRPWAGIEDTEPDLGLRLMRLLLYGLSMLRDKTEAHDLERRVRATLQSRAAVDHSAVDDLYVLDRCSGSLEMPEPALVRNRAAARHFAPAAGTTTVRRPLEYYRCLVNLGASLIANAEYAEAIEVGRRVGELVAEFEPGVFPRTDYPLSNGLLAEYRSGAIGVEQAVARQRAIVGEYGRTTDPFYAQNALAVYLALNGEYAESEHLLAGLGQHLRATRSRPEPSMQYLIGSNLCAVRFVSGDRNDQINEWRSLRPVLDEISYTIAPYLERRHTLLDIVLATPRPMTAVEFDRCLLENGTDEFGPAWDNFGRGFRIPEVEFWRES